MYGGCLCGDWHFRIQSAATFHHCSIGHKLHDGYLHDSVVGYVGSCSLQIEEHQRSCELEFHQQLYLFALEFAHSHRCQQHQQFGVIGFLRRPEHSWTRCIAEIDNNIGSFECGEYFKHTCRGKAYGQFGS